MTISSHPWIKLLVAVIAAIVVGIAFDSWGWGIATFFILMFVFIWVASWIFGGESKGKVEVTDELEEILDKLESIGNIKNELPLNTRGWCNSLGLFVQLREKGGLSRLEAGDDKYRSQIDAWRDYSFEWKVKKYNPGDWEKLVNPTLDIAGWLNGWGGLPEEYMASFNKAVEVFKEEGYLKLPVVKEGRPTEVTRQKSEAANKIGIEKSSNTAKAKTEPLKEWQPLEEVSLPLETFEFLAEILRKVVKTKPSEELAEADRFSRIEVMVDELQNHTRIFDIGTLLLARVQQAHHDNDLRQAIGWLTWLFIVQIYSERYMPDSDTKEVEMNKHYKAVVEPLKATINVARTAKQSDALLLGAGLCDWVGLAKWSDQILEIMRDEVGKQAIADRLLNMKRQPLMLVDDLLVNRLHRYLEES